MVESDAMKVLVTGAAGFLGVHLCQRLLARGDEVLGVDNFYSSHEHKLDVIKDHPNFSFQNRDVIDPLIDVGVFEEIYHLACPASPPRYQKDGLYTLKVNFQGTLNVCELAANTGARLLHCSTSEIYGDPAVHPQTEMYRGNVNTFGPRACYDEGKRVSESLCFELQKDHDLNVSVVRIFNTYGPYMDLDDGRVITNFITQALKGQPLTVYGDGNQTRSLCYATDLIEGFIRANATKLPRPINLGNPDEYTINEIANIVLELTGSPSRVTNTPLPVDDPVRRKPDITLAKKYLSWQPTVSLMEGLKHTIAWAKTQLQIN